MQKQVDRLTNYSTNISGQKEFFSKLTSKLTSYNQSQRDEELPKEDQENDKVDESFHPEPLIEIDDHEDDGGASEIERNYKSSKYGSGQVRPQSSDAQLERVKSGERVTRNRSIRKTESQQFADVDS